MTSACQCQGEGHPARGVPFHHPLEGLPVLSPAPAPLQEPPTDEECRSLWDKYAMLENVTRHSALVAEIATRLAQRAQDRGIRISVPEVRASAMLHDLAKTYCLYHGGSHAMLGAAWVVAETRHYHIARGVMLHVHWPWPLPEGQEVCNLPVLVMYADKRVRHDEIVSVDERYKDLFFRYGTSEGARMAISASLAQEKTIESALSAQLGWDLNEYSFDCRGLVNRA